MRTLIILLLSITVICAISSCELFEKDDDTSIGGEQSAMGQVGTTIESTSIEVAGVRDFSAEVTALADGVSSLSGSAIVTNSLLKNIMANFPEVTIKGDTVIANGIKGKNTTEGIELISGPTPGIIVKYGSSVGDEYPIGSSGESRKVVSKSTTDDYPYGFMYIKVIEVEEIPSSLKSTGISKITYWANHRFGLVGVDFTFDDESTAAFPLYTSAEN
jgi:hypothetical protein